MQSIEAFLFIGGTARIFLFFHRPFHRVVEIVGRPPRPHPKSASGGTSESRKKAYPKFRCQSLNLRAMKCRFVIVMMDGGGP